MRLALAVAVRVRVVLRVLRVVLLVLRVVLLGLLRLVARVRVVVALRVRVAVSPGVVLRVLRVVLLAWLGLGRRAVVRRRMRRGGVTMRWCVWMAWMSPLLV